ncbi:hypothetical protein LZ554_003960 [Drepanopeziza brunnea f. sp. 'monogermtubi']|nr:hypothetical protein LZ554_003960 [Drepanopeziza brunnea f. sp. 'monogermtubi']
MKINSPVSMAFAPPRRSSGWARILLMSTFIVCALFYVRNPHPTLSIHEPMDAIPGHRPAAQSPADSAKPQKSAPEAHPIDTLVKAADQVYDDLLKKESHDIEGAAAEYRTRRGRHPPPGFDLWYKFATERGAVMVEDFFDQIYDDLGPFWGLPPSTMRKEAWDYEMTINIRNHKAVAGSDWFWTRIWQNLTQTIEHLLPDMDMALNAMDEPRIVAPWEEINELMKIEQQTRSMPPPADVISEFSTLSAKPEPEVKVREKNWEDTRPFWKVASRGCHPDSLARTTEDMTDFSHTARISLANTVPHTYKGYVSNFTLSSDFCHQPDLQALHGMMINPLSVSSTKTLFPMFGGSKLPTNNEILLPAPMYWNGEERFSGGDDHGLPWLEKQNKVIWRGVATGGRHDELNWKGFQRHRFVAMTNATQVAGAEAWTLHPDNWALPTTNFNLAAQQENRLGEWTGEWADTGFVDLMCQGGNASCQYMKQHYELLPGMKMAEQFGRKYVPDIDGNSFSGRYRGFLLSTSLPIKATIFKEWHDSRLVPWKHFVPMDNRFMDFWGIMEYFLGYEGENIKVVGHDEQAQKIAEEGQSWANKVLRKEDMQIYVLRLLLEYARLSDDRREKMGWVEDLL